MKSAINVGAKIAALLLAAVMLASCGGAEQRKAKYLAKSKDYIEQKNYDKAAVELKNVLNIDPKYTEAYFLLGQIEEKRQNWNKAFGNYSKVVELNPDHIPARNKLGKFYLLSGDIKNATEMMVRILALQPNDIDGRLLKAAILARQDKSAEAISNAEKVFGENPGYADAVSLLASLYQKQGEAKKAIEVLLRGVEKNNRNIELRFFLAKLYSIKDEPNKIEDQLHQIIAIEPAKLDHKVTLATFYVNTSQLDKAENLLREIVKEKPAEPLRTLLLVDFLAAKRSVALAEKELLGAVQANSRSNELRFALARLYEQTNRRTQAESVYREIIDQENTKPNGLKASVKLAKILISDKKIKDGEKLIKKVLEANPSDREALLVQAILQLSKNDVKNAIVSLRSLLKDEPNSAETLTLLTEAHLRNNEPELAYDYIQKAVAENPKNADVRLKLAQYLLVQKKDSSAALKQIDFALENSPNYMPALLAKIDVITGQRKIVEAKRVVEAIKKAYPDNPVGYRLMGQLNLEQKKYDLAKQQFEIALEKSPDKNQPLAALINVYILQGKSNEAIARLNKILSAEPNNPLVHEVLSEVYMSQKKYDDAKQELRKTISITPGWNLLYHNLASIERARGGYQASIPVYLEGLKAIPDDIGLLLLLAEAYERTQDVDSAAATYEHILQLDPGNILVSNNLAALLADYRKNPTSIARAKELIQSLENSRIPAYMDTSGWVYYKSGELDKSIAILEQTVKAAPKVSIFQYHLGMAYHKQGRLAEAKMHLARAVESKNKFPGIDEARATLSQIP